MSSGQMFFGSLVERQQFQERSREIFKSMSSLDHFIRMNRAELAGAGAIVKIAGVVYVDQEKFPPVVTRIGARRASAEK